MATLLRTIAPDDENGTDEDKEFDLVGDGETGCTNWTKSELIGSGKISEIYRATITVDVHVVQMAVKQINKAFIKHMPSIEESVLLRNLSQGNVLKYFACCTSNSTVSFFFELFKGESLHVYIQEYGSLSEDVTRNVSQQILEGVVYLHDKNIVHRNLKSSNILVDEKMNIKVTDYHISNYCKDIPITDIDFSKTWRFNAPETLHGIFHQLSDIWSIGCIVLHMFTGNLPYHYLEEYEVFVALKSESNLLINSLYVEKIKIPTILENFILFTLNENKFDRPTAKFLLHEDAFLIERFISKDIPKLWHKGEHLGDGGYGTVCLIVDDLDKEEPKFVLKEIYRTDIEKNLLQREAEILLMIGSHERIVPFYGLFTNYMNNISLFLGYMPMGSLEQYYKTNGPLSEMKCQCYTRQILEGLVFLHQKCIVHRDIKAANVLLETEDRVRITDFGISKFLGAAMCTDSQEGSERWVAPEILNTKINDGKHDVKVDIWSLGCTVVEMITGKIPDGVPPKYPQDISEELRQFLNETFVLNPNDRKSSEEMLTVPFINITTTSATEPLPSAIPDNMIIEDDVKEIFDTPLHLELADCKKNPGHTDFIPLEYFKIKHLPINYQDTDLYELIKVIADMTVRVSIKMSNPNRPEFRLGTKASNPFYIKSDKQTLRLGSGILHEVIKYNSRPNANTSQNLGSHVCLCHKCKSSPKSNKIWAKVIILTTANLLFDDIEGKYTSVIFFYDKFDSPLLTLENCHILENDYEKDFCKFVCTTFDIELIDKLERILKSFENLRFKVHNKYKAFRNADKMAFIVSHPHGCFKHISIGQWVDKWKKSSDGLWCKYTYTTCTCPGSLGAHVHIVGYCGRVWHYPLLHSSNLENHLSCSNVGFVG